MTEEQKQLVNDFIQYEQMRGIRSLRRIKYILKVFFIYLEEKELDYIKVRHLHAQEFQTWLSTLTNDQGELRYSTSTTHDIMLVSKNFFNYLKAIHIVYINPFKKIKHIKLEKRLPRDIPDEAVMHEFLTTLSAFWLDKSLNLRNRRYLYKVHVIAEVMYSTGLRLNEVAGIEAEHIDFDRNLVHVKEAKGGIERVAYLNEYAAKVLQIFIDEMKEVVNEKKGCRKIFGNANGRMLDNYLNRYLKRYGKKFNLDNFTSHKFRHSLGYHLLKAGCDLRYIQLILGHLALNSTTIYTKVNKEDLRSELDKYHPRQFKEKTT